MLSRTLFKTFLVVLALYVTSTDSSSCESVRTLNFNDEEGLKMILRGGARLNIVYEDRDDIELIVGASGVNVKELSKENLVAIDVRAGNGDQCESGLFCGDGMRCGESGSCEPDPYLVCTEQGCSAGCDDEPNVEPLALDVVFGPTSCPENTVLASDGLSCVCPNNMIPDEAGLGCVCEAGSAPDGPGADSCSPCNAGTFAAEGDSSCQPCPEGSFSLAEASECVACLPGQYWDGECLDCPAGFFNAMAGETADSCEDCSTPGKFWDGVSCLPCEPGWFSLGGTTACLPCEPGSTAPSPGSAECTPCPAGTYEEQGACVECEAGTFSSEPGAVSEASCSECAPGTFSPAGAANCSGCEPACDGRCENPANKVCYDPQPCPHADCAPHGLEEHPCAEGSSDSCFCPAGTVFCGVPDGETTEEPEAGPEDDSGCAPTCDGKCENPDNGVCYEPQPCPHGNCALFNLEEYPCPGGGPCYCYAGTIFCGALSHPPAARDAGTSAASEVAGSASSSSPTAATTYAAAAVAAALFVGMAAFVALRLRRPQVQGLASKELEGIEADPAIKQCWSELAFTHLQSADQSLPPGRAPSDAAASASAGPGAGAAAAAVIPAPADPELPARSAVSGE